MDLGIILKTFHFFIFNHMALCYLRDHNPEKSYPTMIELLFQIQGIPINCLEQYESNPTQISENLSDHNG